MSVIVIFREMAVKRFEEWEAFFNFINIRFRLEAGRLGNCCRSFVRCRLKVLLYR